MKLRLAVLGSERGTTTLFVWTTYRGDKNENESGTRYRGDKNENESGTILCRVGGEGRVGGIYINYSSLSRWRCWKKSEPAQAQGRTKRTQASHPKMQEC